MQQDQVLFSYCNEKGEVSKEINPNGAINNIAGICNKEGNVVGMMPHPERACNSSLENEDGKEVFRLLYGIGK